MIEEMRFSVFVQTPNLNRGKDSPSETQKKKEEEEAARHTGLLCLLPRSHWDEGEGAWEHGLGQSG